MPPVIPRIKPRRTRTVDQRLAVLAPRMSGDNPVLAAVLDMLEIARTGTAVPRGAPLSGVYMRHVQGRFSRDQLEHAHTALSTLSPEIRSKIAPRAPIAALPRDLEAYRDVIDQHIARGIVSSFHARVPTRPFPGKPPVPVPSKIPVMGSITELEIDPAVFKHIDPSVLKNIPMLIALPKEPFIEAIKPVADAYSAGQTLVLYVAYPDLPSPTFKVALCRNNAIEFGTQEWEDFVVIEPKVLGKTSPHGTRLQIVLPQSMDLSQHIRVIVTSQGTAHGSNRLPINRIPQDPKAMLLASPVLTSILPANHCRPGSKVVVQGMNLGHVRVLKPGSDALGNPTPGADFIGKGAYVILTHVDAPSADMKLTLSKIKVSTASTPGQGEFVLPTNAVPGNYLMQLGVESGIVFNPEGYEAGPESLSVPFNVDAHRFAVQITSVSCMDESDPETFLGSNAYSDEIVAAFGGYADQNGFAKSTHELTEFDDGEVKNFSGLDAAVYPMDGGFGDVKIALGLRMDLFESDASDATDTQSTFAAIGSLATAVGAELLKLGQITAAAIAGIVAAVAEAIAALAPLFNGPDALGTQNRVWTALELQQRTQNPSLSFSETLQFLNGDDDGSYEVTIAVGRLA